MPTKSNSEIITEHFHIYKVKNDLICYLDIMMKNGEYILWEFINHKKTHKHIWKLK